MEYNHITGNLCPPGPRKSSCSGYLHEVDSPYHIYIDVAIMYVKVLL